MFKVSLRVNFYMIRKDQVFVADVMVTNLTRETMFSSVISWPIGAVAKLNAIVKICKYRGLHERHHFIPMAMEVHGALKRDMDCFIKECVRLFHDKWSRGQLSLSFCIQVFKQHVSITLQCVLTFVLKRKLRWQVMRVLNSHYYKI